MDIRNIKSVDDLIRYFTEELNWSIDLDDFDEIDDITYDFDASDIGLKEEAFAVIVLVVCLSLLIKGVHSLSYYPAMARQMVGGRLQFYKGLFMLDIGLTFLMMEDIPGVYIMLYLMIIDDDCFVRTFLRHERR